MELEFWEITNLTSMALVGASQEMAGSEWLAEIVIRLAPHLHADDRGQLTKLVAELLEPVPKMMKQAGTGVVGKWLMAEAALTQAPSQVTREEGEATHPASPGTRPEHPG